VKVKVNSYLLLLFVINGYSLYNACPMKYGVHFIRVEITKIGENTQNLALSS